MQIMDIKDEGDLRKWLGEHIKETCGRVQIEWIEPAKYGSSIGSPDCKLKSEAQTIGLELKYLTATKNGIKWMVRPAQRRYHHLNALKNGRSALLAFIDEPKGHVKKRIVLVRGDHIPLRNYASDPNSGCNSIEAKMTDISYFSLDQDRQAIFILEGILFHEDFWEK
jgi:hypothetical protein